MKSAFLISFISIFAALNASAEIRRSMNLNSVSLNSGILSYSYTTSGGCAEHKGEVSLKLIKSSYGYIESAQVVIEDITDQLDICESLVNISGTANLFDLAKEAAAKDPSIKLGNTYKFVLPSLIITE